MANWCTETAEHSKGLTNTGSGAADTDGKGRSGAMDQALLKSSSGGALSQAFPTGCSQPEAPKPCWVSPCSPQGRHRGLSRLCGPGEPGPACTLQKQPGAAPFHPGAPWAIPSFRGHRCDASSSLCCRVVPQPGSTFPPQPSSGHSLGNGFRRAGGRGAVPSMQILAPLSSSAPAQAGEVCASWAVPFV